jgi:predicted amidohydrolase YtcJ
VTPGSCGCANYTREQLAEIVGAYFPTGWPMACHVQATPASTRSWTSTRKHYGAGHATTTGCDSLEVGKYADMVVLSADPRAVPPEEVADLEVRATFLAGRHVYAIQD